MSRREQMSISELDVTTTLKKGGTALTPTATEINNMVFATAKSKFYQATATLVASKSLGNISSMGLSTAYNVIITSKVSTAPKHWKHSWAVATGGTLTIYAWKATSAATAVPLVAADEADVIAVTVFGLAS